MKYAYNPLTKKFDLINFSGAESDGIRLGVIATTEAVTRYVSTTGSDTEGDGTETSPYATPLRAYQDIPRYVRHKCKIFIEAGTYAGGWPSAMDNVFSHDGSLAIFGVGAPVVVRGPYTIDSVSDRGSVGQSINVTGTPWTTDLNIGFFVYVTSGDREGTCQRIFHNTTSQITIATGAVPLEAGDTFSIVVPAVNIEFQDGEGCAVSYHAATHKHWTVNAEGKESRLAFHNISFSLPTPTEDGSDNFLVRGKCGAAGPYFDFCRILVPLYMPYGINRVILEDTNINSEFAPPFDLDYILGGETGIANLANNFWGTEVGLIITDGGNIDQRDVEIWGNVSIESTTVESSVWANGGDSSITATYCSFGAMECYGGRFWGTFYYHVGATGQNSFIAYSSTIQLSSAYFYRGTNAIYSRTNSRFWVEDTECDPTLITASAVSLGPCVTFHHEGALSNFKGASSSGAKAYTLFAPAIDVKSDSWPSNGTGVNDGMGSFIARHD